MKKLNITLNSQLIRIYIGSDLKSIIFKTLSKTQDRNIFIVSRSIYPAFKELIAITSLKDPIIINSRENNGLQSFENTLKQCYERSLNRKSRIIGIGGGALGDYVGFLAASYMRGVEFVYIPTTLISQCDVVINKVALNANGVKNLIGSFYSPSHIFCDVNFISFLPKSVINDGMSEIVKHALIKPSKLLKILITYSENKVPREKYDWEQIIYQSIKIKLWFIKKDFFDNKGIQIGLNYGHTFAHALEDYSKYSYSHGHSVAIGLKLAGYISNKLNILNSRNLNLQKKLLELTHLNLSLPSDFNTKEFISFLKRDKRSENSINLILLKKLGEYVMCNQIDEKFISVAINKHKSPQ